MDFFIYNPIAAIVVGAISLLPGMLFLFSKHYAEEYKARLQFIATNGINKPQGKILIGFRANSKPLYYLLIKLFGVNGAFSVTKFVFAPLAIVIGMTLVIRGLYLLVNKFL